MVGTKFRGHRSTASEEDAGKVFSIYVRGGHLDQVTQMPRIKLRFPDPRRLHMKFDFDWSISFREEYL